MLLLQFSHQRDCTVQSAGSAKENIHEVFDQHLPDPSDDGDKDAFATVDTLRGSSWRGRDCDDKKPVL